MIFKEFYISDKNGKSNCVVRSLCKILDKEYDEVYNGLLTTAQRLNHASFNDISTFEKYMEDNNIMKMTCDKEVKIKDLQIDNGSYIIFCYDRKNFYHMVPIINNIVYDKNSDCMDLYMISIYKKIQVK